MYFGHAQTIEWCRQVRDVATKRSAVGSGEVTVVVLPSFTAVGEVAGLFAGTRIAVGAQDLSFEDRGPYTGEVSGKELAEIGCRFVEVGHAERRDLFGETDEIVRRKVAAAERNALTPILCVGEDAAAPATVAARRCVSQLEASLPEPAAQIAGVGLVVAYEPVWAIGGSAPAPAEHIRTVCAAIGEWLASRRPSGSWRVIYGGAADEGLTGELGASVDGLFLGRSAHNPARFGAILDEVAGAARSAKPHSRHEPTSSQMRSSSEVRQ
jgi:triosephosphate isomerase